MEFKVGDKVRAATDIVYGFGIVPHGMAGEVVQVVHYTDVDVDFPVVRFVIGLELTILESEEIEHV